MRTEPPEAATLGAQVRAARLARSTSLRALARAIGVSPATLSQIENGHTGLTVVRLRQIADALRMSVPEVLDIVVDPDGPASAVDRYRSLVPPSQGSAAEPEPPGIADWRSYPPLDVDMVLRAALTEFLEIGYHGATVRGIAQRCGLSVSGLYHHYSSKQALLRGLLDHTMAELLARARMATAEGADPVERFSLLVEHLVLYHTHRRELGFVGASEMRSLDPSNRRAIAKMRTTQQRMIDAEVAAAVAEGSFRTDHPHEAARAVVTMCTALPNWWRPDGPLAPEQVARQYVGFALDMMRHRAPLWISRARAGTG